MRVNKEEIDKAREVPVISFIEANGINVKKEGKYHRLVDHDSFVIKGNDFTWNSQQKDGHGAISFAMAYYDLRFPEAVKRVNEHEYSKELETDITNEKQPFKYPKYFEVANTKSIQDYLINERKIDKRVVDWCIKKDLLVQDKKENAVFKWKYNGECVGADRQGTQKINNKRGTFKQVIPNSKEDGGFKIDVGKPNKIAIFESPIDMLSYWSIKKGEIQNTRLQSMSGLKMQALTTSLKDLQENGHKIEKIILCVDNDEGGSEFSNKLKKLNFKEGALVDDRPKHSKDWNDELKNLITKSKSNRKMKSQIL